MGETKDNNNNNEIKNEKSIEYEILSGVPESYQEYLETIYRLSLKSKRTDKNEITNIKIAQYMNIKPSSVTNMLVKLRDHNYIEWFPRKPIILTDSGREIGRLITINHLIIEVFVKFFLHIKDKKEMHEYACKLEHLFDENILKKYKLLIGKKILNLIERYLEDENEPSDFIETYSGDIENMLNPVNILDEFVEFVIRRYPDYEERINKAKENFLNEREK